jgi:hypothetical protein
LPGFLRPSACRCCSFSAESVTVAGGYQHDHGHAGHGPRRHRFEDMSIAAIISMTMIGRDVAP